MHNAYENNRVAISRLGWAFRAAVIALAVGEQPAGRARAGAAELLRSYDCSVNGLGGSAVTSPANSTQASTTIPAGTWTVDPVHSSVDFQVRNMGIVWVNGFFADFKGTVESTGEPAGVRARGTVEVASVSTRSDQRDQHLRGAEFFDAENQPHMTFQSTRVEPDADGLRVVGDLTIKNITREVQLHATVQGTVEDPWGNQRVGAEVTGTVNRRDFDLNWDVRTPGGATTAPAHTTQPPTRRRSLRCAHLAAVASDDVRLILHLGAVKSA